MRVWLLGGFRVAIGPKVVEDGRWRLRKAAALVKLLALAPGHSLHREQAMDILWPDSGRQAASNSLRGALHAARGALDAARGPRYLASENEHLVLCPGGQLWVDVDAFEEAATGARRSREPVAYRAAIDLYAGNLLPSERYEDWVAHRREELRQRFLTLLLELAKLHEERGEHEAAAETLQTATAEEPTVEEAHAVLMRLHALSGRPERALVQYERLRDALLRRLGTRPSSQTRRLRDEIATGEFSPAPAAGPRRAEEAAGRGQHNLPAPRSSFVGREREMVQIKRALSMTRLLTITGTGGSGKTRLALEIARALAGTYPDGARLVELAPLPGPELVAQEVARAVGVPERPGASLVDVLVDTLRDREMLLVLDNCEHLAEESARLADTLLDSSPRLQVLATSREPLGTRGETLFAVLPLSLPPSPPTGKNADRKTAVGNVARCEAARLFVERARQRLPDFRLTEENVGAVATVCRRLDGIPLAIELATARMGVLAVEQVAQRLAASLDVLGGAGRTAEPRQRTLRATLDWSFALLSEEERILFQRLSVFAGGCDLQAAEATCSGRGIGDGEVLDLVGGLVDKSLVVAAADADGAMRYRMLEPVRQYAAEKLEAGGEAERMKDGHAAYFLSLAEEAEPELSGPHQGVWIGRLDREHDNLRDALTWYLQQGQAGPSLRLGAALWRFWYSHGYLSEGVGWMERVLAVDGLSQAPERPRALEGMGWLLQLRGDFAMARTTYQEMLAASRELGDKEHLATALNSLGTLAAYHGDHGRARELLEENLSVLTELEKEGNFPRLKRFYVLNLLGLLAINQDGDYARGTALWEESLSLAKEARDAYLVGIMFANLGYAALLQRDFSRATALCEKALTMAQDLESAGVEFAPTAFVNLGLAALGLEDYGQAAKTFEEALRRSRNMGTKPQSIDALEGSASLAGATGADSRAARLWGAAESARESADVSLTAGERALHEPYLAEARARLGAAAWEEALREGRGMSLDEATGYALSKDACQPGASDLGGRGPDRDEPTDNLTPREREVAVLVARGLTNRAISEELFISERTAGNHVAKILRKLGLRSRARIASWAAEQRSTLRNADRPPPSSSGGSDAARAR